MKSRNILLAVCRANKACRTSLDWIAELGEVDDKGMYDPSAAFVVNQCTRPDWLAWFLGKVGYGPRVEDVLEKLCSLEEHREFSDFEPLCAETLADIVEDLCLGSDAEYWLLSQLKALALEWCNS